jgi:hypothetical protein
MRSSLGWVLAIASLLALAGAAIFTSSAHAKYNAEANAILKVGAKIPL